MHTDIHQLLGKHAVQEKLKKNLLLYLFYNQAVKVKKKINTIFEIVFLPRVNIGIKTG